jgi:hypothetical protein
MVGIGILCYHSRMIFGIAFFVVIADIAEVWIHPLLLELKVH